MKIVIAAQQFQVGIADARDNQFEKRKARRAHGNSGFPKQNFAVFENNG